MAFSEYFILTNEYADHLLFLKTILTLIRFQIRTTLCQTINELLTLSSEGVILRANTRSDLHLAGQFCAYLRQKISGCHPLTHTL